MSRRRKSYAPRVVMCHDKNCLILHDWHQGASSEMSWSEIYEHWNHVQQQSIIYCMFFWCRFTVPNNTNANKAHKLPKCIFPQTPESHTLGEDMCLSLKNHKQRFVSFFCQISNVSQKQNNQKSCSLRL